VALGASFLRRFPLGDCEVRRDWLPDMPENNPYACVAMGVPGKLRIIYTPFSWDIPPIQNLEPDVTYAARFFNTRSGEVIDLGEATPENGTWKPPLTPEVHDWLVALEAR
jgi:hypothetical protein